MLDTAKSIAAFCEYVRLLEGDEKGEAQVFCDRLFQAFGHKGYKEAGAKLEERLSRKDGRIKFADLRWGSRLLLEMKKRGERLGSPKIYSQIFEYWVRLIPNRPRYVVLCNFDELWIYEFDQQIDEPMDRIKLTELPNRYSALGFLFPEEQRPLFNNNRREVTEITAQHMGELFRALRDRGETHERAQRFTLQCVMAMFAEDTGLLPADLFTQLLHDCKDSGHSSYDLLGGLFRQMNDPRPARAGRFRGVRHFNGGLFEIIDPIELHGMEIEILAAAAAEKWNRVHPAIFGNLFQASMNAKERHQRGAHYTPETAIFEHVIRPTLVEPLRARIASAKSLKALKALRAELVNLRILDPACGSGNFLYVAYRELKRLEIEVLERIHDEFSDKEGARVGASASIQLRQFYGIDRDPFAVDLAKVTLLLAKKLALDEAHNALDDSAQSLGFDFDQPLPLENLDERIRCDDALFCAWPEVDIIIGNPPFQSKNKMQEEFGPRYLQEVRAQYPGVPGHADYCVYWFRRTHDELPAGGRAGLVGTNTIRQNYSREGGLDYIVSNGGTITEAVSTMVWPGDAVVHVSIANWVKGTSEGSKKLSWQEGDVRDSPWSTTTLERIPANLSARVDVTSAVILKCNVESGLCYQGQTHGHEGFLLEPDEARAMIHSSAKNRDVLFPYLIGEELLTVGAPTRYVIDFHPRDLLESQRYKEPFARIKKLVLPTREDAAKRERSRNSEVLAENSNAKVNHHHANFLKRWWLLSYPRGEMINQLSTVRRYIACCQVTKRPIFEFINTRIRPNAALIVFPAEDDYSFGVLQSGLHWLWFTEKCSTMKGDWRYTSNSVFDTFPWPQDPGVDEVRAVARAAVMLRKLRRNLMQQHSMNLRELYASMEQPGKHPLKDAHALLDRAVANAYGMGPRANPLVFLLDLNRRCAQKEAEGELITGPGLPSDMPSKGLISDDAVIEPRL